MKWSRRHRPTVLAGVASLVMTLAVSTAVLWEAKRRTDATLDKTNQALSGQFITMEFALGTIQQITRPLIPNIGGDAARSEEAKRR